MSTDRPLGLPGHVRACLFDLDGVLTETAKVHAAAWKETFDAFLKTRADKDGVPFVAFDVVADYDTYVDGKPRSDGTRSFLESHHIHLPEGSPDDPPTSNRKRARQRQERTRLGQDQKGWCRGLCGLGPLREGRARWRIAPGCGVLQRELR